jgi:hypothetical protein
VLTVGATATITAQQEFVSVAKASEQGVVGEPNTLCAAFQFRRSPDHPFDRVHIERNKISEGLEQEAMLLIYDQACSLLNSLHMA